MPAYYVTTPIYYVNDVPHIGHAYTTLAADTFARFHRMLGEPTRFLTGTDEHGQKIEDVATSLGRTPSEHTDLVAPRFAETWTALGISHDDFIRTTEPRHKDFVAKEMWRRLEANGDLYLAAYEGWYCVGCEAFYTESQLEKQGNDWHCTTHRKAVQWVAKERSWFFRLSKYEQPLLDWIEKNPTCIWPENYRNEVVSFVRSGLRDLSVSRTSFGWGIPVPTQDPEGLKHVMYVWLDALTNYLSALGPLDGELSKTFWGNAVHLIGKDILRFHAVYWPAFLMAAKLPLPRSIVVHGWWAISGAKISKSLPATRIDPLRLAEELAAGSTHGLPLGVDAMRYYLLREVPLGNDGDFTFASLAARYNAELANDLGNLANRSLTLLPKLVGPDVQPARDAALAARDFDASLEAQGAASITEAKQWLLAHQPSRALEAIWRLVREGNRYVDGVQPWRVAKGDDETEKRHVAYLLATTLSVLSELVAPVLPYTSGVMRSWLHGVDGSPPRWPSAFAPARAFLFCAPSPLFPRIDPKRQIEIELAVLPPGAVAVTPVVAPSQVAPSDSLAAQAHDATIAEMKPAITIDDFGKVDLRVGIVVAAASVPKAKKLLQLTVDLGEGKLRTIVSGIAEAFVPEQLVGQRVVVVANLQPATIRGISSEGMILAAGDNRILGLASVPESVAPGASVR